MQNVIFVAYLSNIIVVKMFNDSKMDFNKSIGNNVNNMSNEVHARLLARIRKKNMKGAN